MEFETIKYEVINNVGRVTLNRPKDGNSLNEQMIKELMYVAMECDEDPNVRCVLLTGTGPMFCVGGDLRTFAQLGNKLPMHIKEITAFLHSAVSRFMRGDAPIVVGINGSAAGAGLSLACMGDVVLASDKIKLAVAYTQVGLSPDGGLSYFLPRRIGLAHALEMTVTGRRINAEEAKQLGIVTGVHPADELHNEAIKIAEKIASGPTQSHASARHLIYSGFSESLETQLELESRAFTKIARTADSSIGMNAFLEKREGNFTGK